MKITVRKNGKKYKVYAVTDNDKYVTIPGGSFELNQKRLAENFAESCRGKTSEELKLKIEIPEKDRWKVTVAFREFAKTLNCNEDTKDGYLSILKAHILPYIEVAYMDEYKYPQFEKTIQGLLTSHTLNNGLRTKNLCSKNLVNKAFGYFKRFLKHCDNYEYGIDKKEYLKMDRYEIHNRQLDNRATTKDDFLPSENDVYNMIALEKQPGKKAFIHMLAETGMELSAALGVCYDNVTVNEDTGSPIIQVRHSVAPDNSFRPNYLKTDKRKRDIEITPVLKRLLEAWMALQINPKTFDRKYKRIFPYRKEYAAAVVKKAAKRAGVEWKRGVSPFRKYSSTMIYNNLVLTGDMDEYSFARREGWDVKTKLQTFHSHYQRPLPNLNKNKLTAAYKKLTNGGKHE